MKKEIEKIIQTKNFEIEEGRLKMAEKKEKVKRDIGRIATKIIAAILAIVMILAVGATLVYYLTVA